MKLETHMHTSQVSHCGRLTAEEMALRYVRGGYGAAVVTDHINRDMTSAEHFLSGYRAFQKAAEPLGLRALLGAEARLLNVSEQDFLIYGLKEADIEPLLDILKGNPTLEAFAQFVRGNGWLMIQAHPYRDGRTEAVDAKYLDGVEIRNVNQRHDNGNGRAAEFAEKYGVIAIGGSDAHREEDVCRGGIVAPDWIATSEDLAAYLRKNARPEVLDDTGTNEGTENGGI